MITKNFKSLLGVILQTYYYGNPNRDGYGMLEAVDVNGDPQYLINYVSSGFPASVSRDVTLSAASDGISVGGGDDAASEDDYNLKNTITSGISLQLANVTPGLDDGDPYIEYVIAVTNNGDADVTINEIGYKQSMYSRSSQGTVGTFSPAKIFLLDRTVLATPLTIAPGRSGVINYTLKTKIPVS